MLGPRALGQAISIMSQAGVAKLISFNPVRWGLCWNLGHWARPSPPLLGQAGVVMLTAFNRAARWRGEQVWAMALSRGLPELLCWALADFLCRCFDLCTDPGCS